MKCVDCQNQGMCLDHKEQSSLIGCTSGIPQRKEQTNADRIRSMSDEELAEFIERFGSFNQPCSLNKGEPLKWLQSEVE